MASITLQNIVKEYGTGAKAVPVIHNLNAQINDGEFVVIVGPSGCGKSTLGRLALRLIEPTQGQVIFDGQDLAKLSSEQLRSHRKAMQIIFQDR